MNHLIRLDETELAQRVRHHPAGYREEIEKRAVKRDETGLWLEPADWMWILARYNGRGLGTRVYKLAHPIAVTLDGVFGTRLANCHGCAERMELLNLESRKRVAATLRTSVDSRAETP